MNPLRSFLFAVLLAAAGAGLAATADAGPTVGDCQECHGDKTIEKSLPDGKTLSLFVDEKEFRQSVHGKGTCMSCHPDAKAPHGKLGAVTCGKCHPDAEKSYSQSTHGMVHAKGVQDVPGCDDCHGKHDIRKAQDPKAPTFRRNTVEARPRELMRVDEQRLPLPAGKRLLDLLVPVTFLAIADRGTRIRRRGQRDSRGRQECGEKERSQRFHFSSVSRMDDPGTASSPRRSLSSISSSSSGCSCAMWWRESFPSIQVSDMGAKSGLMIT